jgi:hypothetical protein
MPEIRRCDHHRQDGNYQQRCYRGFGRPGTRKIAEANQHAYRDQARAHEVADSANHEDRQ